MLFTYFLFVEVFIPIYPTMDYEPEIMETLCFLGALGSKILYITGLYIVSIV